MILPFREGFNFTKLRICEVRENKTLAKISEFTVYPATEETFQTKYGKSIKCLSFVKRYAREKSK